MSNDPYGCAHLTRWARSARDSPTRVPACNQKQIIKCACVRVVLLQCVAAVCKAAARSGHLPTLQHAWSSTNWQLHGAWGACGVLAAASRHGHLPAVQWICGQEPLSSREVLLFSRGAVMAAAAEAAAHGHIHVLSFLRDVTAPVCPWNKGVCIAAARSGQLHVLHWLLSQTPPCPCDESVLCEAARCGQLHVVQWLRSKYSSSSDSHHPPTCICPWSASVSHNAAVGGHLPTLQWLLTQARPPCPFNRQTSLQAVEAAVRLHTHESDGMSAAGVKAVLQWLAEHPGLGGEGSR
jgi:hypothetical protein